jgi:uncharacterized phage-associated protein
MVATRARIAGAFDAIVASIPIERPDSGRFSRVRRNTVGIAIEVRLGSQARGDQKANGSAMTNIEKLKSVIAYVAAQRPGLGKVKLFKLLYLIDFTAVTRLGAPITGDLYENFEMGPVPRTLWRNFDTIAASCVDVRSVETGMELPEQQMRPRAGFTPDLTAEERAVADEIMREYGDRSGTQLKNITHDQLPYKATPRGEIIPYGLAGYLNFQLPTPAQAAILCQDTRLMTRLGEAVVRNRRVAR